MNYVSPEERGLSSEYILEYIKSLEEKRLSTHSLIIMRGNDILFEKYWEPFHPDFLHRMYSVTKSFVALAVGFLEQDGYIDLDDKISKYFPEELRNQKDDNMKNQTIRHMLMMSTAKPQQNWLAAEIEDRVQFYFENDELESRPSGTFFSYDSTGSFVLGAMVERLTKMSLIDYLREKLFDKIGVSKEAYCLKCPGGHSWSDSALVCKPSDLLKTARFVMNHGRWNGEQILNEKYILEATGCQIYNDTWGTGEYDAQGYGYLFWRTYQNSFFFNGMGCQLAVCVPDKDLIMVYNGDNQGNDAFGKRTIIDNFFSLVVNRIQDEAIKPDLAKQEALRTYAEGLKLAVAVGDTHSPWEEKLNGITYQLDENPMGITSMKLTFYDKKGCFAYTNAQGYKEIEFGMGENVFGEFPQEGYSDEVGGVASKGYFMKCAASAAWVEPHKLYMKVQIIDKYMGKLNIILSFQEDRVGIQMIKVAEGFLQEYAGWAGGTVYDGKM